MRCDSHYALGPWHGIQGIDDVSAANAILAQYELLRQPVASNLANARDGTELNTCLAQHPDCICCG